MNKKVIILGLLLLFSSCDSNNTSLQGGVIINGSEFVPTSVVTTSSSSITSNNTSSSLFDGKYLGVDNLLNIETSVEVKDRKAILTNEYGYCLELEFFEETVGNFETHHAFFKDDEGNTLELEDGSSYMFITLNEGDLMEYEGNYFQYDGIGFERDLNYK